MWHLLMHWSSHHLVKVTKLTKIEKSQIVTNRQLLIWKRFAYCFFWLLLSVSLCPSQNENSTVYWTKNNKLHKSQFINGNNPEDDFCEFWKEGGSNFFPWQNVYTVKPVYNGHPWGLKKVAVWKRGLIKLRFRLVFDEPKLAVVNRWPLFRGGR
jgi:hypothetical protein